jgi:hypothetical protein
LLLRIKFSATIDVRFRSIVHVNKNAGTYATSEDCQSRKEYRRRSVAEQS